MGLVVMGWRIAMLCPSPESSDTCTPARRFMMPAGCAARVRAHFGAVERVDRGRAFGAPPSLACGTDHDGGDHSRFFTHGERDRGRRVDGDDDLMALGRETEALCDEHVRPRRNGAEHESTVGARDRAHGGLVQTDLNVGERLGRRRPDDAAGDHARLRHGRGREDDREQQKQQAVTAGPPAKRWSSHDPILVSR